MEISIHLYFKRIYLLSHRTSLSEDKQSNQSVRKGTQKGVPHLLPAPTAEGRKDHANVDWVVSLDIPRKTIVKGDSPLLRLGISRAVHSKSIRVLHSVPCSVCLCRFGADYYSFWWGGVRGLVLNTNLWACPTANPVREDERLPSWYGERDCMFVVVVVVVPLLKVEVSQLPVRTRNTVWHKRSHVGSCA